MNLVTLARGWVFDGPKLTRAVAEAVRLSPSWAGWGMTAPKGVIRYLSLGDPSPSDITPGERDDLFAAGYESQFYVQHVNWPGWMANNILGTAHGAAAKRHADMVCEGIVTDLGLDLEGLGNAGAAAYDYIAYWSDAVRPYGTVVYDGYDDGLAAQWKQLLVARGCVREGAWWPDFATGRMVPAPQGLRVCMRQKTQRVVAGHVLDPDEVLLDGYVQALGAP